MDTKGYIRCLVGVTGSVVLPTASAQGIDPVAHMENGIRQEQLDSIARSQSESNEPDAQ
jgi:hypothetical protein